MRWMIGSGEDKASISLPGGVLGIERAAGMVGLAYLPGGEGSGNRAQTVTIAHADGSPLVVKLSLPKAPVIVKFSPSFVMAPDTACLLGLGLPLDAVVESASGVLLWEFRSADYRKGWAGGLEGGEACLALSAAPRAVETPMDAALAGEKSGFSVSISNYCRRMIEISDFTVPARNLRLYARDEKSLCDGISLSYGPEDEVRVAVRDLKSAASEAGFLVAEAARESPQEQLLRKGRHFLKNLAGWGAR